MSWFNKLTVGGRLICGFAVMIVITAVVGGQGIRGGRAIHGCLQDVLVTRMPSIDYLLEADRDLQQLLVAERSLIFSNADSNEFKTFVGDYETNLEQAWARWEKYKELATTPQEREVVPKFEAAWKEWSAVSRRVVDGRIADTREGRRVALDLSLGLAREKFESMREQIDRLTGINLELAKTANSEATAAYHGAFWFQIGLAALGILTGLVLALVIRRSIAGPLNKVIRHLTLSSEQLASASRQIAAASQNLAEGSSQQAAAIEQTSSSLEEMASMTRKNAGSARDADGLMQETKSVVATADSEMEALDKSMQDITTASKETQKIVRTIDEISFQTNLLALNAAVEAARAGEAGKGFAVVAEEVRGLAQRAAEASRNTASLIDGTVAKIHMGSALVTRTISAFHNVEENTAQVGKLVSDIATASGEQAQGIDQINRAVTDIDSVTQSTASSSEESASAAAEMTAQAEHLLGFVAELQAVVGGAPAR